MPKTLPEVCESAYRCKSGLKYRQPPADGSPTGGWVRKQRLVRKLVALRSLLLPAFLFVELIGDIFDSPFVESVLCVVR